MPVVAETAFLHIYHNKKFHSAIHLSGEIIIIIIIKHLHLVNKGIIDSVMVTGGTKINTSQKFPTGA